jgi:hypothetical protein
MNRILMTGVKGIQNHLIHIREDQFDTGISQQLTDKTATDVTCSKM